MHLTSMKLKFGIDREYNADRFKDDSYKSKVYQERKKKLNAFSYLRQYPISSALKRKVSELRDLVLYHIFDLSQGQLNHAPKDGHRFSTLR
ncbi:unnamed protein product [marine sediment metagenome]|uniref:Uncharacterized protein n=1 Tax=marine sediment metagenome TaxID=412755 RepID=X1R255_9ZZZZ